CVLLVVHFANRPAADVFSIARMLDQPGNLHAAGFLHLVAGHHADLHAALAAHLCAHLLSSFPGILVGSAPRIRSRRSRRMVWMRATSRLALRISLGVSSRSVADWKRR